MNMLKGAIVLLVAGFLFSLAGLTVAQDDEQKAAKEKPKEAPTLDDEEQEVTITKGTKAETKKIELKYYLQVSGYFDKDGYNIEKVTEDGPATQLMDENGMSGASMEVGDIIVEVDGKKVASPDDDVKAINGVSDHEKIKLKIKDKNTGNDVEYYASAHKR
jgi:S1-C subfamily serine protease